MASPLTPMRRSRRQAGKESGVEWSKESNKDVEVSPGAHATSYVTGYEAKAEAPKPFLKPRRKQATKEPSESAKDPSQSELTGSRASQQPSLSESQDGDQEDGKWHQDQSPFMNFFHTIFVPLFLMTTAPLFAFVITYITTNREIKTAEVFLAECTHQGFYECIKNAVTYGHEWDGLVEAFKFLAAFNMLALLLFFLPSPQKEGPITATGHTPKYVDNGMLHCVLFTVLFFLGSAECGCGFYSLSIMYDTFPASITILNGFGLVFCLFLVFKGYYFPSTADSGPSGDGFLFDYYWGGELYPRIFGVDVKQFINCRFSMTFWMLSGVSFAVASFKIHSVVDPGLALSGVSIMIYLAKFYWWEIGYMRSIDIIVDRAGFYETWGCIVWVPTLYTTHSRAAVLNPSGLSWEVAGFFFVLSLLGVVCNFLADNQRQAFRECNGDCLVWGEKPKFIRAFYTTRTKCGTTERRESLLLASGWWGVARHFHYFFELLAAWSWGVLSGLHVNKIGFAYPVFLTILLMHRAQRDQEKCEAKYGKYYRQYMELVPYKIIPGIY